MTTDIKATIAAHHKLVMYSHRKTLPNFILQLESLLIFLLGLYIFSITNYSWVTFVLLFFVPDISLIGYIFKSKKYGAILYNLIHNYVLALMLFIIGSYIYNNEIQLAGIILTTHISFDRFIGYGLRYPDIFKITHLQKV